MSTKPKPTNPPVPDTVRTKYPGLLEPYTPERIAEFLLNNAVDAADYAADVAEVRKLGIDPSTIRHEPPQGV